MMNYKRPETIKREQIGKNTTNAKCKYISGRQKSVFLPIDYRLRKSRHNSQKVEATQVSINTWMDIMNGYHEWIYHIITIE